MAFEGGEPGQEQREEELAFREPRQPEQEEGIMTPNELLQNNDKLRERSESFHSSLGSEVVDKLENNPERLARLFLLKEIRQIGYDMGFGESKEVYSMTDNLDAPIIVSWDTYDLGQATLELRINDSRPILHISDLRGMNSFAKLIKQFTESISRAGLPQPIIIAGGVLLDLETIKVSKERSDDNLPDDPMRPSQVPLSEQKLHYNVQGGYWYGDRT